MTLVRVVACGRMVGVGSIGIGGAGMTQLKGLRTSKTPGVPASAAFAAFAAFVGHWAVFVVVLPYRNNETEESRHLYRLPGRAVGL